MIGCYIVAAICVACACCFAGLSILFLALDWRLTASMVCLTAAATVAAAEAVRQAEDLMT